MYDGATYITPYSSNCLMRPTACYEVVYHARQSSLARRKFRVGLGKAPPKLWRARESRLALTSYQGDEGCIKQPKVVHHTFGSSMNHWGIQSSRSTSSERFILEVMVEKMRRFCRLSGMGNSIFRSNLPGRRRAGSRVSDRLVAMITCVRTCLGERRWWGVEGR